MKRRPIRKRRDKGGANWLTTYADMVTLVLVFFIFLFSMSQVDHAKFQAVTESFQGRHVLDFLPSIVPGGEPAGQTDGQPNGGIDDSDDSGGSIDIDDDVDVNSEILQRKLQEEQALNELVESIEGYLDEHDLNDAVTATRTERGVLLVLQDSIFFDTGEAVILDEGKPFLNEIGRLFSQIPNDIKVEGHTDSRPINTYRYPSNWELSGARASSVVRYLLEEFDLDESRFSIAGYGDTRPVAPNDTEENMSLNRRVEITILNTDFEEEAEE